MFNCEFYNLNVVASLVGIEKEFKSACKFLGNLVHPTPWLITRLQDVVEGDFKRQEIFIASVGINSYLEVVANILGHLRVKGCEAIFSARQEPWLGGPLA